MFKWMKWFNCEFSVLPLFNFWKVILCNCFAPSTYCNLCREICDNLANIPITEQNIGATSFYLFTNMSSIKHQIRYYRSQILHYRKKPQVYENSNAPSKTISVHCSGEVNFATCKAEIASCFVAGTPHMCGIHLPPPYTQWSKINNSILKL